ncbi:MAG: MvaI/BcnI family restriction endonuclease, partial [Phycisphaerales bacterium]
MTVRQLLLRLTDLGATEFYGKRLAPNDNSKNQVYVGGSTEVFTVLPPVSVVPSENTKRGPAFKASVDFWWISDNMSEPECAIGCQLIYYAQYPEIRMSGFLRGCKRAPSEIMCSRDRGRLLILGLCPDGRVYAFACGADHAVAKEIAESDYRESRGVFFDFDAPRLSTEERRRRLLTELCRVSRKGWITGKRLRTDGSTVPCNSTNCGGFTLEAELGIAANSHSEPDFHGWELKSYTVRDLARPVGSALTLMTPEPNGGVYSSQGAMKFVREYGYADLHDRPDRINFGGVFRANKRGERTGLTLLLRGFDCESMTLVKSDGMIALVDDQDEVAASWSFSSLLAHWNRKHESAVFVPVVSEQNGVRRYRYGDRAYLGLGTNFLM